MRHTKGPACGLQAAILALVLYVVAPVVHAFVHPDHGLTDWVTEVFRDQGPAQDAGAKDLGAPAAKRTIDPHACKVLQGLTAAPCTPVVLALPHATATLQLAALPDALVVALPRMQPQGRAPPQLS